MTRRFAPAALALVFVFGCAGPAKLAQRSQERLDKGEYGRAWELAVRALNKEPGNASARAAAAEAGNAMARDWERRIHALAQSDSLAAAEQVLALNDFRVGASRYAPVTVTPTWAGEETALRQGAARTYYQRATADLAAKRPKRAYFGFGESQRFVTDYRDAAKQADKARDRAFARVAIVPFATAGNRAMLGRDVAAAWRDDLAERLTPPDAPFTSVLGSPAIEQQMNLSQLGRLSRADAIRLAQKAGAQRVVWGSIGDVDSKTTLHLFTERIARRVTQKDAEGHTVTRWVDEPVEVVSRVRTVTVDVDYEVISTREGATLAHRSAQRSTNARVVWTSFAPEGDLANYVLVSDETRASNPDRAKAIEARWKDTCGEGTTLRQVLEARRAARDGGRYDRGETLKRFVAGTAFVFLQELPPVDDLAYAALARGWEPLHADLLRLDATDDVDLGVAMSGVGAR